MDGYILRDKREQLTLPADAADKLLRSGQGDAALLYLALRRFGRGVTPEELEKVLPISRLRIDAAEKALQELGLLPRPEHQVPPAPADERPVYTAQDIAGLLTDNEGFRLLVPRRSSSWARSSAPQTCRYWPGSTTTWACPPT